MAIIKAYSTQVRVVYLLTFKSAKVKGIVIDGNRFMNDFDFLLV